MSRDMDSLVALYIAGLCGIGYGLRQIIETQDRAGASVDRIVISGGAGQLPLVRQLLADAAGRPVVAVEAEEPVLLGSAILGAVAAGAFDSMPEAMAQMTHKSSVYAPDPQATAVHQRRYDGFRRLQDLGRSLRD